MSLTHTVTEGRNRFGQLVRRASHSRERITITDHGQPAAVLINADELADLEEANAVLEYKLRRALGQTGGTVPAAEARRRVFDSDE
ncbi:type II toxin-antitoxin system Phd/YefM family antitoxin [Streptomyces sp. NBC_01808]|uniref:type II toxin-antitoxin system Phd/YefM family antitoxin n=1 Tax=Streptomyces sp. NBC_01808 TaxID=2975947 RepID=UPI002DD9E896|nr:type II toxin-antitoxin system Phd/YefM family antitoxin [Streptomyces sp. NBC_01808]WSA39703.1 type II toxin-antitoxin system Phd/YefM family antitoxin [Streptomyces sp. NBC_01808]